MREIRRPGIDPYLQVVVDELNVVFGTNKKSTVYWNTTLPEQLKEKFDITFTNLLQALNVPDVEVETKVS